MSHPESITPAPEYNGLPLSAAAQRFGTAIRSHPGRGSTAEIRDATCEYVRELRERSVPPERVLVQIKSMLSGLPGRGDDTDEQRQLLQQVITWCIEAYYGTI